MNSFKKRKTTLMSSYATTHSLLLVHSYIIITYNGKITTHIVSLNFITILFFFVLNKNFEKMRKKNQ